RAKLAHYKYDGNGNRLLYEGPQGTHQGRYDEQDRLVQYGEAVFAHTDQGEWLSKTIGKQTTRYGYDGLGGLREVTLPDGKKIEYVIDGGGRRVGKKVNGTLVQAWLYEDDLRPVAQLDGQGNLVSRFAYATGVNVPDYMEKDGKTYYLV